MYIKNLVTILFMLFLISGCTTIPNGGVKSEAPEQPATQSQESSTDNVLTNDCILETCFEILPISDGVIDFFQEDGKYVTEGRGIIALEENCDGVLEHAKKIGAIVRTSIQFPIKEVVTGSGKSVKFDMETGEILSYSMKDKDTLKSLESDFILQKDFAEKETWSTGDAIHTSAYFKGVGYIQLKVIVHGIAEIDDEKVLYIIADGSATDNDTTYSVKIKSLIDMEDPYSGINAIHIRTDHGNESTCGLVVQMSFTKMLEE